MVDPSEMEFESAVLSRPVNRSLRPFCPPVFGRLGEVQTGRLLLQPMAVDAGDLLAPVFAKPEVWRFPFGRGFERAETDAFVAAQLDHWDELGFGVWLVSELESGLTVGFAGLSVPTFFEAVLPAVEVGWRFDPDFWGRGYATEAAMAALAGGFETLGLSRIISLPQTDNPSSVRVAERIGLSFVRQATAPATLRRGPVVVSIMEIGADEWRSRSADPE